MLLYGFVFDSEAFEEPSMMAVTDTGHVLTRSVEEAAKATQDPSWRLGRDVQTALAQMVDSKWQRHSRVAGPRILVDVVESVERNSPDWNRTASEFVARATAGDGMKGSADEFATRCLPIAGQHRSDRHNRATPDPVRISGGAQYFPRMINGVSDITALRAANKAVMNLALVGPPGTGKTTAVQAAFPTNRVDLHCVEGMAREDVVGALLPTPGRPGDFEWVDGPLPRAMMSGSVLLLDDAGWIPPGVQAILHSPMDKNRSLEIIDRPGEKVIHAQPGFTVAITLNPGIGFGLTDPIWDRMALVIDVPIDFSTAGDLGVPPTLQSIAEKRYQEATDTGKHTLWVPSMRELVAAADTENVFGLDFAVSALAAKCPADQRADFVASASEYVQVEAGLTAVSP